MTSPSAIQYSKILLELLFNEDLVWYFSNVRGWCIWMSFTIAIAATIATTTGPIVIGAVFTCTPIVNEQWARNCGYHNVQKVYGKSKDLLCRHSIYQARDHANRSA